MRDTISIAVTASYASIRALILSVPLAVAISCAAIAQDASPPASPASVEQVVVSATRPGPALWHVAANGSDVWILGTVSPMPKDLQWNTREIESIVQGANIVYLPPELTAGFFEVSWFLITDLGSLKQPNGHTLRESLPAELRARFDAELIRLKKDGDVDENYLAAIAALDIENESHTRLGLDGKETGERIAKIARTADVATSRLGSFEAMPVIRKIHELSPDAEHACLADALDDIDSQTLHADAAARAWAVGDVAGVKANYTEPRVYRCFDPIDDFATDRKQVIDNALHAVDAALAKPGKSLIVFGMGPLLGKDGLLERLRQRGIAVTAPAE
jgi:uncharacterized protein YbaP (TraB family)